MEHPDTLNEQGPGRLQLGWKGRVTRGMVVELHLQSELTFYRGCLAVSLTRGNFVEN